LARRRGVVFWGRIIDLVSVDGMVVCMVKIQNGHRSDILIRNRLFLSECVVMVMMHLVYLKGISAFVGRGMEEQMWMATEIDTRYLQRRWNFVDKDTEGWMQMMGTLEMVVQMDKTHLI